MSAYMVSGTSFNVKSALSTLRSNITIGGSFDPLALTQAMTVTCIYPVPSCYCGRVFASFLSYDTRFVCLQWKSGFIHTEDAARKANQFILQQCLFQ